MIAVLTFLLTMALTSFALSAPWPSDMRRLVMKSAAESRQYG